MTISRRVRIAAPAQRVWDLVSDLPAMGALSQENTGGSWQGGATGPAVGARFTGRNRNGWRRWSTTVRVSRCEPGRAFAFEVAFAGIPVSEWAYEVTGEPGGCTVSETWTDRRPAWFKAPAGLATGVRDRAEATASGIEHTLSALKRVAEARTQ
jgi:hypothetical protein